MSNEAKKEIGHIISHTHWDREWRVPIWNTRLRLIKMFESLLDTLRRNPDFKHFLFDGQVVGVEDYLEFCPDRREEIVQLISARRLQIGPWYTLPDEYPVCGEALVRNILVGIRKAAKLGGHLNLGYITFGWGQTAQLPQILKSFDIDFVVAGKNVSKQRAPYSEFIWRSPDGTEILATRLGEYSRANFYFDVVIPVAYGVDYWGKDYQIKWGQGGWLWHSAGQNENSEMMCIPEFQYHRELLEKCIDDAWQSTVDTLVTEHRFMGNGCDFTAPIEFLDRLISDANRLGNNRVLKHSGIEEYASEIKKVLAEKNIKLNVVEGELRDGPPASLSANALASRMPLKMLNREAQNQLIRYAETFASLAMLLDVPYPSNFIDKAWHYLLLAHAHDSINGVTLDKTAEDTAYKLKQVVELAQVVTDSSVENILQKIDLKKYHTNDILLAVFNPVSQPTEKIIKVTVDIPEHVSPDWLGVSDFDGTNLQVQPVDKVDQVIPVNVRNNRAVPYYATRHSLYLKSGMIPACGYKILKVEPKGRFDRSIKFWPNVKDFGTQITGPKKMANEYLEVAINPDGTFDLLHKQTQRKYDNLNFFEETGDVGDYWQRVVPEHNRVYTTLGSPANVYLLEDGPLVSSFICEMELDVPVAAVRPANARDTTLVPLKIKSRITLYAGCPYVEIKTTVSNQARDHRIRVCLPTFIETDKSVSQGHFNVDERLIARPRDELGMRDAEMGTSPHQNFIDLSDGRVGLAVLNKNIIEYEVSEQPDRTLFLTLLRCVPVSLCTEFRCATTEPLQDGPQCLGNYTFEYAVYPHKGGWDQADLYGVTENFVLPPRVYQISKHNKGSKPQNQSLLSLKPASLQISAVKKAQDGEGIVVRLFNPGRQRTPAELKFAKKPQSASLTNLNEQVQSRLAVADNGVVKFIVGPCKIVTVLCKF